VENVPDPKIERPTDVIVQIRSTNICGSDLHMFEGRTDFETGRVFGHENLGQIKEVGPAVERFKVGFCPLVFFVRIIERQALESASNVHTMRRNLCLSGGDLYLLHALFSMSSLKLRQTTGS
jgi:threonine dehydrogenase-like Zn-dependent dehydrogenase